MGLFNRRSERPVEQSELAKAFQSYGRSHASPFTVDRNLTAAASLMDITTSEKRAQIQRQQKNGGWQDEAWFYVKSIGEIYFALNYVANAVSRVKLYAGEQVDPTAMPKPVDKDSQIGQAATEVLLKLRSANGGLAGLMHDIAFNWQAVGECYLVQRPANPYAKQRESWDIRSKNEMNLNSEGYWEIKDKRDGSEAIILPKNAYVARIWNPDPEYSGDAISSMMGILDLCAELLLINKSFRGVERSRLNSGILYVPDGLSVAASADPDATALTEDAVADPDMLDPTGGVPSEFHVFDPAEEPENDEFEEALLEAITTPIADEESVSAVAPLIVRGPAELGEKIRLIQFERSFDPMIADRADKLLERVLQGLDIPKDIVKGMSSLKFSASQMVDIQLSANHVEPLALAIGDALTTAFLHPHLRAMGFNEDEIQKVVIWYDAVEVTRRPNRAEDAERGYANHNLSGAAWRKAHQFTDEDAPTSTELALRLMIEKGQMTPDLFESLLTVVAPEMMAAVRKSNMGNSPLGFPGEVENALGGEADPMGFPGTNQGDEPVEAPEDLGLIGTEDIGGDEAAAEPAEPAAEIESEPVEEPVDEPVDESVEETDEPEIEEDENGYPSAESLAKLLASTGTIDKPK